MRKQAIVCVLLLGAALAFAAPVRAQQIEITEMAGLAQIFGEAQDNDVPLSMNDMDMVSGGIESITLCGEPSPSITNDTKEE